MQTSPRKAHGEDADLKPIVMSQPFTFRCLGILLVIYATVFACFAGLFIQHMISGDQDSSALAAQSETEIELESAELEDWPASYLDDPVAAVEVLRVPPRIAAAISVTTTTTTTTTQRPTTTTTTTQRPTTTTTTTTQKPTTTTTTATQKPTTTTTTTTTTTQKPTTTTTTQKPTTTTTTTTKMTTTPRPTTPSPPPKKTAEYVTDFMADPSNVLLMYSAYYNDVRRPPVVTVLVIANRTAVAGLRYLACNLFTEQTVRPISLAATLALLPDHHEKGFAPAFIHCLLPNNVTLASFSTVSITLAAALSATSETTGPLPVQLPASRQFRFLICFSPLHHNFDDFRQVVANLELARALGAEHAVVYNNSIGPNVDRTLRLYGAHGFLDTLGWRGVPEDVHYQAQTLAVNDCLMRHRHRTRWIVFMDFDEMIVPRVHSSWADLLHHLQAGTASPSRFLPSGHSAVDMAPEFVDDVMRRSSRSGLALNPAPGGNGTLDVGEDRLLVRNGTLVATNWTVWGPGTTNPFRVGALAFVSSIFLWDSVTNLTVEDKRFADRIKLSYLLKQKRTAQLWPLRSKNIVDPRTVDVMGIHRVFSFLDAQHKTLVLNETVGMLHHYRWYNPNVPTVKDINVLRFASLLVQRMNDTFHRLGSPV